MRMAESFRATDARIGKRPILFEMEPLEAVDIDTPEDWRHAEILASAGFAKSVGGAESSTS